MKHPGPFARYAAHMLQGGYSPVPLRPGALIEGQWIDGSKHPLARVRDETCPDPLVLFGVVNGWDRLRTERLTRRDIAAIVRKHPKAGIGVMGGYGGLVPIDVDTDDPEITAAVKSALPPTVGKRGQRGLVRFYRSANGGIGARKFRMLPKDGKAGAVIVEVLTTGKTALPPSIHPDLGKPYAWLTSRTLYTVTVAELPPITPDHIAALAKALRPWVPPPNVYKPKPVGKVVADVRMQAYARAGLRYEAGRLAAMPANSGRAVQLFNAACKLGKYVHHRVTHEAEVVNGLMGACQLNRLRKDNGEKYCLDVIRNGFRYAVRDALPAIMGDRR